MGSFTLDYILYCASIGENTVNSRKDGILEKRKLAFSREVLPFSRSFGPFLQGVLDPSQEAFFSFSRKNTLLNNAIFSRIYSKYSELMKIIINYWIFEIHNIWFIYLLHIIII